MYVIQYKDNNYTDLLNRADYESLFYKDRSKHKRFLGIIKTKETDIVAVWKVNNRFGRRSSDSNIISSWIP